MTTMAARIARKVRGYASYWADWESPLHFADHGDVVAYAEESPIGELWQFRDGSILMSNDVRMVAVARGYDREIAMQFLEEVKR